MSLGSPIAHGNTAKIYLKENQIIKVYHRYFPQEEAINEATKQELVRRCGLPVPKIIDITKVDGSPAIVMEYVKGKTLGELIMEDVENANYYLNLSVKMQRKIHDIYIDSLVPMSQKLKHQIHNAERLNSSQKNILTNMLEQMSYEGRLCHGDFHVYNLILSDSGMVVIDWVDASLGDIRADVCRSYLLYKLYSLELADLYLNIYCEKSNANREQILQWEPIIAGAKLSEKVESDSADRLLKIVQGYLNK